MVERLRAPVAVAAFFDHRTRQTRITRLSYDGRDYPIKSISYHFTQRKGRPNCQPFPEVVESNSQRNPVGDSQRRGLHSPAQAADCQQYTQGNKGIQDYQGYTLPEGGQFTGEFERVQERANC